jgi:hypothetical protein
MPLILLFALDLGCRTTPTPNETRPIPPDRRTDFNIQIGDKESQTILIQSFKIKQNDTIVSLKDRLSIHLTQKNNSAYNKSSAPEKTKKLLRDIGVTKFPLVVTKLFLGYEGSEITEDTALQNFPAGSILALSKKVEIDLENKNLRDVRLYDLDLTGVNLKGATLIGTAFMNTNLTGANLTGANLTNATLMATKFINANLTNANLTNANLGNATLTGANLTRTIVSKKELSYASGVTQEQLDQVIEP